MPLHEVRVTVPVAAVEAVDELLLEFGDERWSVFEDVVARTAFLLGVFADATEASAGWEAISPRFDGLGVGKPEFRELADADWRESYKLHFKPWRIGRLHWVPVWERDTYALPAGDQVVWLDPGMAFGTGNHETTRLCVERMVELARAGVVPAGVVDAGCGSGILAISAVKLGFGAVAGFDNDPEAVRVAVENAELNAVADRVDFRIGDLDTGFAGRRWALVLANIQADVLVRCAARLLAAVEPGGVLVLSGILAQENEAVRACFAALAPRARLEFRTLGEWSDVLLRT
jgi:ribosomal protein L11 methyltransferase